MSTSLRSLLLPVLAAATLATALTGCANGAGASPAPESTAAAGGGKRAAADAAWLTPDSLVVRTWGSGCAPIMKDLVVGDQVIEVSFDEATGECPPEQRAHGTFLGLPAGLDSSKPIRVVVTEADGAVSEDEVPALASGEIAPADRMPEQRPAAGWIDDDELAVLTWGSSSCAPGSGQVEVSAEREGVVTLHEHTDTVCTMDMAPRITFVKADGLARDAVLTLARYVDEDGAPITITPTV